MPKGLLLSSRPSLRLSDEPQQQPQQKDATRASTHSLATIQTRYQRVLQILKENNCSMANAFWLASCPRSTLGDFIAIAELWIVDEREFESYSSIWTFRLLTRPSETHRHWNCPQMPTLQGTHRNRYSSHQHCTQRHHRKVWCQVWKLWLSMTGKFHEHKQHLKAYGKLTMQCANERCGEMVAREGMAAYIA